MAGSAVSWLGSTLVVCAALTACSASPSGTASSSGTTSSDSPTSSTSDTPSASATSSAPTVTSAPPSASATTTGTNGAPTSHGCANGDLSVAVGRSRAAAGHVGVALVFRNVSHAACSLYGYPGVAGLDSRGRQAIQATRTSDGYLGGTYLARTVVVPPGGSASALVEGTDVPAGSQSCATYSALLVIAPGQTRSQVARVSVPGCPSIQVHPVVPGVDGRS
ncbi:DUF4232 domain-containing protein [Pedococcus sp.]|uniref:DUF4232 domain-containing protein n=1 Tax=Pedococcus sp. TaxID=2860345 RepID=UPI002E15A57C|nr:DUF4232 domain-containing protein [Pedococcus sp.]